MSERDSTLLHVVRTKVRCTIPCHRRIRARLRSEPLPECEWERDQAGGYRCCSRSAGRDCGQWIAPGMARHGVVAHAFGEADTGAVEAAMAIDGVRDEVLERARAIEGAGETRENALVIAATELVIAGRAGK